MLTHTGGGKRPRALAKNVGRFASVYETGNPNGGGLPEWRTYSWPMEDYDFE